MKVISFKGQDFKEVKKKCNSNNLFIDPLFTADNSSLMYCDILKNQVDSYNIKWKRPKVYLVAK